jgi:transcriptional regulator with XRE-family HTH domain
VTAQQSPTLLRRRLGMELRRLREEADMTMERVAAALGCSISKVSRIETNQVAATPRDVSDMLQLYGVTGRQRDWLLQAAEGAREKGWWTAYASIYFSADVGLEVAASSFRAYQALLVPGLLQTTEYAEAVLRALAPDLSSVEHKRRLELRMRRKELLEQPNPPMLWAILDEAVLRRTVGGRSVMREQLLALHKAAEFPHVTLQVLPFGTGGHIGMDGGFAILGFPEKAYPDIVYLEHFTRALILEEETEVERFALAFDYLRATALNPADSVAFLARVAEHA